MPHHCEPAGWLENQQALLLAHPLPAVLTSMKGATLFANPAACQLFDIPWDARAPLPPLLDLVHPDEVDRALWLQMDFIKERMAHFDSVLRMRTMTGRAVVLRVIERILEAPDQSSSVILLAFEDQTLLHELQVRQRELASAHSIMTLASDSSHDLISMLSAINILASEADEVAPSLREKLAVIARTSARAAELARPLLHFSNGRTIRTRTMNVSRVIGEVVQRLQSLIGTRHTLQLTVPAQPVMILSDEMLVEQVLLNLVSNAAQAMAAGGVIRISLSIAEGPPAPDSPTSRRYALLSVVDTGIGMDKATSDRATERFFTTRAHDGGNGLGLSIVKRIIDGCDGLLDITSAPNEGTTIEIRVPLASHLSPGEVRLALLDGNPLRRAILRHTLSALGFSVIENATIEEVRSRIRTEGEPVLLLAAVDEGESAYTAIEQQLLGLRVLYLAESDDVANRVRGLDRHCLVVPRESESRKAAISRFINEYLLSEDWNDQR